MNVKGKRIIAALLAGALLLNNSSFYSLAAEISGDSETGYAGEVVDEPEEKEETEESTPGVEIADDVSTGEDNGETDTDNASGNLADDSGDEKAIVDNGSMTVDDQMNVSEDITEISENMQETVPETIAEGSCGENLTWTLDKDGLLKIEGTGSMTNYKSGTAPWFNHKESVLKLKIDDGVGTIGSYAFYGCNNLTGGLELPKGLQTIGEYAFYNCNKLEGDLNIPDSVTSIGSYAFYGCGGFKGTLKLSEGLKTINPYTFASCSGLSGTLRIPDNVKSINYDAFRSCRGFTDIVLGSGVTNMHGYSYSYASSPSTHECSFYDCSGVETVIFLGETVPVINSSLSAASSTENDIGRFFGSSCFAKLKMLKVPEGCYRSYVSAYGSHLQGQTRIVEEGSEDFIIENGVLTAYIGSDESVTVPDGVTEIGENAFLNNTSLTEIVLPEGLEVIGNAAFKGCSALTGIKIPEGVTKIGNQAFYNCTALSGTLGLPESLTEIGSSAFNGCKTLRGGLTIPSGITELKPSVFSGCAGLDGNIRFPEGLTSVGNYAFNGCQKLTGGLEFPEGLQRIGEYAL